MLQTLPMDGFEWRKDKFRFDEEFIHDYDEESDNGYILEVDGENPKELHWLRSDLQLLFEQLKINKWELWEIRV